MQMYINIFRVRKYLQILFSPDLLQYIYTLISSGTAYFKPLKDLNSAENELQMSFNSFQQKDEACVIVCIINSYINRHN